MSGLLPKFRQHTEVQNSKESSSNSEEKQDVGGGAGGDVEAFQFKLTYCLYT